MRISQLFHWSSVTPAMRDGMRYRAFLSYRREDLRQAVWLQGALERFRTPRIGTSGLHGPVPARLGRIFHDRDDARTADDIETLIAHELKRSEQLIVLCTPGAVAPEAWVPREIELFRNQRPGAPIHAVTGKGEPPAVLPRPLLRPGADGEPVMPLAADLRKRSGDGKRRALASWWRESSESKSMICGSGLIWTARHHRRRPRTRCARWCRAPTWRAWSFRAARSLVMNRDLIRVCLHRRRIDPPWSLLHAVRICVFFTLARMISSTQDRQWYSAVAAKYRREEDIWNL
ncbi:TIR domain-containing protein [Oxalobacteraceae bacterium]|nr:TIR domain-containing protein [Oxalobacteraceae bacterium]